MLKLFRSPDSNSSPCSDQSNTWFFINIVFVEFKVTLHFFSIGIQITASNMINQNYHCPHTHNMVESSQLRKFDTRIPTITERICSNEQSDQQMYSFLLSQRLMGANKSLAKHNFKQLTNGPIWCKYATKCKRTWMKWIADLVDRHAHRVHTNSAHCV